MLCCRKIREAYSWSKKTTKDDNASNERETCSIVLLQICWCLVTAEKLKTLYSCLRIAEEISLLKVQNKREKSGGRTMIQTMLQIKESRKAYKRGQKWYKRRKIRKLIVSLFIYNAKFSILYSLLYP